MINSKQTFQPQNADYRHYADIEDKDEKRHRRGQGRYLGAFHSRFRRFV